MSRRSSLDAIQLRDVQDILRKPLTGRRVLIPVGTKAFVDGELRPNLNDNQEETIQLRESKTGEFRTVSRTAAIGLIQQEIKDQNPHSKKNSVSNKSVLKPSVPPVEQADTLIKEILQTPNFFEIREEIDEQGREVHAEAVNITDHLKRWEKEVQEKGSTASGNEPYTSKLSLDEENNYSKETKASEEKVKAPSDDEFAALSARLDELVRLEESEEVEKIQNKMNFQKLQGKGWSKGFLNQTKQKPSNKRPEGPVARLGTPSNATRGQLGARDAHDPSDDQMKMDVTDRASGNRVGFSNQDQVHEIPRIGQRSVSHIPKPVKPIQASAVFGVVRERKRAGRQKTHVAEDTVGTSEAQQPRRLSRFAQQRMGQGLDGS